MPSSTESLTSAPLGAERPLGPTDRSPFHDLLRGYHFYLAQGAAVAGEALAVRREVYGLKLGFELRAPDEIDERSWLIVAEQTGLGRVVGTMRLTPRHLGPLECERFFTLPPALLEGPTLELTRMAILPGHRRSATSLPVVSVGLFKLVMELALKHEVRWLAIASRQDQLPTYEWLGFQRTGQRAAYEALGGTPHELLIADFQAAVAVVDHPFRPFFLEIAHEEIEVPEATPEPGAWLRALRQGQGEPVGFP